MIVGVNKYVVQSKESQIDVLSIDNTNVRNSQIEKLNHLRTNRDETKSQACMDALTDAAETGKGNLLALAIDAARARCSVGEISYALEKVLIPNMPTLLGLGASQSNRARCQWRLHF